MSEKDSALFMNLVMMLGASAMQQLGKVVDPETGQAEVDLQGAQLSIDMLSMLKAKTEGNLDDGEARLLKDTLASLQLNFVETKRSASSGEPPPRASEAAETAPETEESETPVEPEPAAKKSPDPDGSHEPRFHKSYGS